MLLYLYFLQNFPPSRLAFMRTTRTVVSSKWGFWYANFDLANQMTKGFGRYESDAIEYAQKR